MLDTEEIRAEAAQHRRKAALLTGVAQTLEWQSITIAQLCQALDESRQRLLEERMARGKTLDYSRIDSK